MSFDLLSALKRLETHLTKKLEQRARGPRRWILVLVLVLAPVLSLAAYAATARWLLSGPKLRSLINSNPEALTLDYDEASSLWPGRVTIRNLRIRGSDQNVQWIIRLSAAQVDYSVPALATKTFRAKRLQGSGLSFFLRNKIEAAKLKEADVSVLAPIPGFADPPLRATQPPVPAAPGHPWRVDVRTIHIDHFDDIWVDAFHYRGIGRLDGGFFLRPGLLARIGPARVNFESGDVHIGHADAGISVSGTVAADFDAYEPARVHGSEVWQKVSGEVKLDTRFGRLASLQHLFRSAQGTRLESGAGQGTIRGTIEHGIAKGEVRLAVAEGSVRLKKLALQGDADLNLRIPRWNLVSGPLEISGSRLALSDVRSSGSDNSRRWWGRFDIPSGKIGTTSAAKIEAKARDARPLLALLAAQLPAWTHGLVDLDDFRATASVDLGPSLTRVRQLDARGGNFQIRGRYARDRANREGAFLIESAKLAVGIEIHRSGSALHLVGAKDWYEAQVRKATTPSDRNAEP